MPAVKSLSRLAARTVELPRAGTIKGDTLGCLRTVAKTHASCRARTPIFLLALLGLSACEPASDSPREQEPDAEPAAAPLSAETRAGPVTATVLLTPANPRLGDALTLRLVVTAEPGVTVEMPAFGEALGRFPIVDFTPRRETSDAGARLSQRYTLQTSVSGRQRIPRLRVEFVDEREGRDSRPSELLTEELGFQVASVLPANEVALELRAARPPLPELAGPWWRRHWPWFAAAAIGLALAAAGFVVWRRGAEQRARLTAFDRATARLERLRRAGLPDATALDAWYVELSDIVRRYIEERFALRAPERTTEEFLVEAGRSALSDTHRQLLSAFLEACDRVKFARYQPGQSESEQALQAVARFLDETRHAGGENAAVPNVATVNRVGAVAARPAGGSP